MKSYLKSILFLIGFFSSYPTEAQISYQIGAAYIHGSTAKLQGSVIVGDSTITFIFKGKQDVRLISSRTNYVYYVTDGDAMDMITIVNSVGTKKGFKYNTSINIDSDSKSNPTRTIYYAIKKAED